MKKHFIERVWSVNGSSVILAWYWACKCGAASAGQPPEFQRPFITQAAAWADARNHAGRA